MFLFNRYDEHGQKIERGKRRRTLAFCDEISQTFKDLTKH